MPRARPAAISKEISESIGTTRPGGGGPTPHCRAGIQSVDPRH